MKAVYRGEWATVICGDAREVLPTLGRESVDCIVTDPPYGVDQRSNTRAKRFERIVGDASQDEARALLDALTPEMVRVLRRSRHIYTFGLPLAQHHLLPPKGQATLIWDKARFGSGDLSRSWATSHETIYFQLREADRANAKRTAGLTARMRQGTVLRVPRLSALQVRNHPTEKPVPLIRQLVESSSLVGELILDPFAGSGSTGVAAVLAGRRTLLVELDESYCEIAASRCAEAEAIAEKAKAI